MILKSITDYKKIIFSAKANMEFANIEAQVEWSEQKQIVPLIGQALYDELGEEEDEQSAKSKLARMFLRASAFYTHLNILPQSLGSTGDGGTMQETPQNTMPMTKWGYIEALKTARESAEDAIEAALVFLESHKEDETFQSWIDSAEYLENNKHFITNASELTKYFPPARYSRRFYLAVRDYFEQVEQEFIKPLIGDASFNYYKGTQSWTIEDIEVLRMINYIVANHAVAQSIEFININSDFRLLSTVDGLLKETILPDERRTELKINVEDTAKRYTVMLKNFMNNIASETKLTHYFTSPLYEKFEGNDRKSGFTRKPNDPEKSYIRL